MAAVSITPVDGSHPVRPALAAGAGGSRERAPAQPLDLEGLYRAHVQDVARWVQQLGGPAIDVEDLVHEVFLIARDKLDEFRGEARVTTWLYRITFRVVWAHRRKQRRRRWLQIVGLAEEAPVVESPARMVEARQKLRRVYSVLDELPEKQRAALILFEIEGLSGEEIAAVMDMKLPAVWVLLHRARQSFQSRFERDGED